MSLCRQVLVAVAALSLQGGVALAADSLFVVRVLSGSSPAPGTVYALSPPSATFTVFSNYNYTQTLMLSIRTPTHSWTIDLAAGRRRKLEAGVQGPALRTFPAKDTLPSFELVGPGFSCDDPFTWFDVHRIAFDAAGKVSRLRLFYERACSGNSSIAVGEIRLDADTTVTVNAPLRQRARRGQALSFDVRVVEAAGSVLGLTAIGLPAGASFVDRGDGTGRFSWTPPIDRPGDHRIAFAAADAFGHADTAHTMVRVDGDTLLDAISEPGDRAWLGQNRRLRPGDMRTTTYQSNYVSGFGARFFPFGGPELYRDFYVSGDGSPLPAGNYSILRRWSDDMHSMAIFYANFEPGSCGVRETHFRIRRLFMGPVDSLREVWLEWEQHCDGEAPAFRGELRVNAGAPVTMYAPIARRVHHGDTLRFTVMARDTLGRAVTITTAGLPSGATLSPNSATGADFVWAPAIASSGAHTITFIATNAALQADTIQTDILVTGDFSATFTSEGGDPAGLGRSEAWTGAPGRILRADVGQNLSSSNMLEVELSSPVEAWSVSARGLGEGALSLGRFTIPWPPIFTGPFLSASFRTYAGSVGGAEWTSSELRVRRYETSLHGLPTRFWLQFEQRADDRTPILRGEIRQDVTWRVMARAPMRRAETWTQRIEFEVTGETPDGEVPVLSLIDPSLRGALVPVAPGRAEFRWAQQAVDVAVPHEVGFIATRSSGEADTAWTILDALPSGSLQVDSAGRTYEMSSDRGQFRVHGNSQWAQVSFSSPHADTIWNVSIRGYPEDTLRTGVLTSDNWPYGPCVCADVPGDYWFPCADDTGRFEVQWIARAADGSPTTFWAAFDHSDWSGASRFSGTLKLGPTGALDAPRPPAPAIGAFDSRGLVPNPATRASRLQLALPRDGDLQAEMLDLSGRRVAGHTWHGLTAGVHLLAVPDLGGLPAGLYFMRMSFEGRSVIRRTILLD